MKLQAHDKPKGRMCVSKYNCKNIGEIHAELFYIPNFILVTWIRPKSETKNLKG